MTSPPGPSIEVERTVRGRGGFTNTVLVTIPEGMDKERDRTVKPTQQDSCDLLTNFVRIKPMNEKEINQYRVDFEPEVESVSLRRLLFNTIKRSIFPGTTIFDDVSDLRAGHRTPQDVIEKHIPNPQNPDQLYKIRVKHVGVVSSPHERLRIYNMHMKRFLADLGFFKVSKQGVFVHPSLSTLIGERFPIRSVRGFNTAANLHRNNELLMNFDGVSKLMQQENVLQVMGHIRRAAQDNYKAAIKAQLQGKLVVTSYKPRTYRIEDVLFDQNPRTTFERRGQTISLAEYLKQEHNVEVRELSQPLLLCVDSTRKARSGQESIEIKLVPECCNIAGLTEEQANDRMLKTALIKASQIAPDARVEHLRTFLRQFHDNAAVRTKLSEWGYSYEEDLVRLRGRILTRTKIGVGGSNTEPASWPPADDMASFDRLVLGSQIKTPPPRFKMGLVYSPNMARNYPNIRRALKNGMDKIGLIPNDVKEIATSGDQAQAYVQTLREMPPGWCALVLVGNIQKPRYDAIKKLCSVDRGAITQVVTEKLMTDERKAGGASVKIAIQLAAKLGAEPWHVDIPLKTLMVCGYDTYHDTAQRGRSYGAFVASINSSFSQWFSKADSHERLDELSSHMAENLTFALKKYQEKNDRLPERIVIYRDGVGDGQLEHVHDVELSQLRKAIAHFKSPTPIRLALVVVNKRIGARFYRNQRDSFVNACPGTVVDDVVTREERFDFYLVSQSTRHGTLTPTYYNILANDNCCLSAQHHQLLAYKLCFLYYNWTGTVRVPAPCQYAHKLAYLCGEHLHSVPHADLDDRLHFL